LAYTDYMDPQSQRTKQTVTKVNDDFEAASRATAEEEYDEYEQHAAAYRQSAGHPVRKMFIILGIVVLVAAIGFAVYWFLLRDDAKKNNDTKQTNQSQGGNQQDDQPAQELISTKTEHYVATNFSVEFDHPADWNVSETAGEGTLTVTSPALQLESATGETKTGQIVFMIRNSQQELKEFDGGNAEAVLASEKINYLKPSSVQRGATYLSFLQYAASGDGLDGVYITGDYGYQKDQAIPKADVAPVDPRINLVFTECAADVCGENTPLTVSADMWQNDDFAKPIKAIFQSLTVN
jgi:hypothetical protein